MPDESGWTVQILKEYMDTLFAERDRYLTSITLEREKSDVVRSTLTAEALKVALDNMRQWQTGANEWRGAMTDRERNFVPRSEYDTRHVNLEQQLREFREEYRRTHEEVVRRLERDEGRRSGASSSWVFVGTLVGLIVGLLVIYGFLSTHMVKP